MVTAEGVFPKIGNDPVYVSEVNRFNPKLIGNVSQYVDVGVSGILWIERGGTVTYPGAGNYQISDFMKISIVGTKTVTTAGITQNGRIVISGAGLNNMVLSTKNSVNAVAAPQSFNHILTAAALTASGGDVGSPYVISFQLQSNGTQSYMVDDLVVLGY